MIIRVLGGGPGGLYSAILAKLRHPSWDVQVYERNGPTDTFGWGVVFSDETLSHFDRADGPSYLGITDRFVRWQNIDTWAEGEKIRSTGHGFCGIARMTLLHVLQDRCRELGVPVHFRTEVSVEQLSYADLVVAADGINSRTRASLEAEFQPNITWGKAPFIWLGTDRRFEAFTFIFKQNDHGTFQVHAYPFADGRSTFIVETDEATFLSADFASKSTDETVVYLEALFATELEGARLLSNQSAWVRFRHVTNRTWHTRNVVLIGDAAHTAHYSIGSGTKLAMEDAIALVDALDAGVDAAAGRGVDISRALAAYEKARWTEAAKLQRTARVSQGWFENAGVLQRSLPPLQLVASMMTRSSRVTHDNLRRRDPALVERLDTWFAGQAVVADPSGDPAAIPPPMFTPFALRGLRLENRVVVSPMCQYSAIDGAVGDWHLVHYGSRAVGGVGLIIAEMTDVSANGRITEGCAGLYRDEHVAAWRRVTDFVHTNSTAKIAVQLAHAGRKGATTRPWETPPDAPLESGWPLLAPSAIPYHPGSAVPVPMTRDHMDAVRDDFVRAAQRAEAAGFDMLELHMAHGYLLSSFLSPISNRRDDAYGGALENRMRFPLEVFDAVRGVWPQDRPISVRLSATDWVPGALDGDDAVRIAAALKDHGADIIDVSTGQTSPDARPEYGRMYQTPFANVIRHSVGIATMAVGAIQGWDHVNTIIATGRADLCALARPHLAEPYLTLHAAVEQGWELDWPVQYRAGKPRG